MPTAAASKVVENGKAVLELARRCTLKMVKDIPDDKLCTQPVPNANHALWVLGHLTCTDNSMLTALAKRESMIDESWNGIFNMGSKPVADPKKYPKPAEVKAALTRCHEALIEWFESLDEKALQEPLPKGWEVFAPNRAALMASLAWHEGLHSGQISAVRRKLGLPPALDS